MAANYDFNLTRDTIIQEVLEQSGRIAVGATPQASLVTSCAFTMNTMLKSWQARGLMLWTYKTAYLFLQTDKVGYNLGPSGYHCTKTYVQTALTTAAALGATTLTLDSIVGMTNADAIGIELDDGSMQWTTIVDKTVLSITTGLASAAAAGNIVFTYTTKIQRPLTIMDNVMLRDTDGNDQPVSLVPMDDYRRLPSKTTEGDPVKVAYDPQLTNGALYAWPEPSDVTKVLVLQIKEPILDMDEASNAPEFPVDWSEALITGLLWRLAPKLRLPLDERADLLGRAQMAEAGLFDTDETEIRLVPDAG